MNIWKILDIDETKDKEELKRAYRRKLTSVNPEDDAEGFMQLRRAYEEALKKCDDKSNETINENLTGVEAKIDSIYNDFDRRIDVEEWRELFNEDEFVLLESSESSFDILIKYILKNHHIPNKVYRLIVDEFDIRGRKKELSEIYPPEFIDYLLHNSKFDDTLDYYMFDGDTTQFDKYIELYFRLDLAYRKNELDKVKDYLDELSEMDVYHPYLEIVKIRFKLQKIVEKLSIYDVANLKSEEINTRELTDEEKISVYELKGDATMLLEDFPEDITILNCIGDLATLLGDYDEAGEIYQKGLSIEPDNYLVKEKTAELLYRKREYVASRDLFMELLRRNHYDNRVRAGMIRANQGIIANNKKKLEEDPSNNRARFEMAWSYYQSYMFEEGLEVLDSFGPEENEECEYYNVKGRTYLCKLDYYNALKSFFKWKEAIEKLPDEAGIERRIQSGEEITDEEKKVIEDKKKRYPYVNFLIADCYIKLKDFENAKKYLKLPLETEHDERVLSLEANCELLYETGEYSRCLDACDSLSEFENRNYMAYIYRAKSCFKLNYLAETLKACEKAVSLYPYTIEPHVLEIELYQKINQIDNARIIIERYKSIVPESDTMDYYSAVLDKAEGNADKAIDILCDIKARYNSKRTDLDKLSKVLSLLGDLYDEKGRDKEAIDCCLELIEIEPDNDSVHAALAYMYKKIGQYKKAIDEYTIQLKRNPQPLYYVNRGILNNYFENYKSALNDFNAALLDEPNNAFCYRSIGIIYQLHREYDKALDNFDKCLDLVSKDNLDLFIEVKRWKARTYLCMVMVDEAIEILSVLYDEHADQNIYIGYEYAQALTRANRYDEAKKILIDYIESSDNKEGRLIYARLLLTLTGQEQNLDESIMMYRRLKENVLEEGKSDDMKLTAYMARIFVQNGKYVEAADLFYKAISIDKRNEENYYSELVDALLRKSGIFKPKVDEYVKKAIIPEKDMKTPRDFIKMARLYRAMKKYDLAMEYIDKAIKMRRCYSCEYGKCEEALYEKALIYEAMKENDNARRQYKEALLCCGHQAYYRKRITQLELKGKE